MDYLRSTYSNFFRELSEILDITDAQKEKAKQHYQAVGNWLSADESPIKRYDPQVYPQGSFRLGTVIRPLSGKDEFDIDLVCELTLLSKDDVCQEELKRMVGDRLKENSDYERMMNEDEGRRCWTINYREVPGFHLDILPAIPEKSSLKFRNEVPSFLTETTICITDSECDTYKIVCDEWNQSNPKGYDAWFREQMKVQITKRKIELSEKRNISIEEIKDDEVKTPLQRAIQILKRHRDLMFGNDEDKPISIIITTLAAHAYNEEDDIYDALINILDRMPAHIRTNDDGECEVLNPVNPYENFADKWSETPQKEVNFREWMEKAKEDIKTLLSKYGIVKSSENLREAFGKREVNLAAKNIGIDLPSSFIEREGRRFFITDVPHKQNPSWPVILTNKVTIQGQYSDTTKKKWHTITDDIEIPKRRNLRFIARTDVSKPFDVFWQVVNTGEEAKDKEQLRGEIFPAKAWGAGGLKHEETTLYQGNHWIECFIVKNGRCVARSGEKIVRVE